MAFNHFYPDHPDLKVRWIRNTFTVNATHDHRESILEEWEKWQSLMRHLSSQAPPSCKSLIQTSKYWNRAAMEVISMHTAIFSVFFSVAVAFVLALAFSSSPTLSIIASFTTLLTVSIIVGWMCIFDMFVGSVEAVALTAIVGMLSSFSVHMMEGYIEFVYSARSHLLAEPLKRKNCMRGMLLRTGVPLTGSCICVILCSLLLLFCKMQIFVRMGQVCGCVCVRVCGSVNVGGD